MTELHQEENLKKPGIEFSQVTLRFDGEEGVTTALSNLTFSVNPGESVALIGPSGCGKSTTLRMVAGLLEPSEGQVLVGGKPVEKPRQKTAYIPQNLGLFPWKTVYQNASCGLAIRKVSKSEIRKRTMAALREVKLDDFARAYPRELSGGMQQRLALARAIALDMNVLLMDEPLSAIDALLRESLQDTLLDLWKKSGHTQMFVTHSIEEAVYLGERILVLTPRPGRQIAYIDNPGMGEYSYRDSEEFIRVCRKVRASLALGTDMDLDEVRS